MIDRGGGLLYDDVLNITWLQDANYAKTSGFDADGKMTWDQSVLWAANLTYFDTVRGVTYDDWRLPTVVPVDGNTFTFIDYNFSYDGHTNTGYNNVTQSELAWVFYHDLGNQARFNDIGGLQSEYGLTNTGLVQNLQSAEYWYGTECATLCGDAWRFNMDIGYQGGDGKFREFNAWAVRDGDVAAMVPEPSSLLLLGISLAGVFAVTFKKPGFTSKSLS